MRIETLGWREGRRSASADSPVASGLDGRDAQSQSERRPGVAAERAGPTDRDGADGMPRTRHYPARGIVPITPRACLSRVGASSRSVRA